jgi:1-acyl-sn-glycerol-3-phosphate acyltransferase
MVFLRALTFNVLYYGLTLILAFALLPALLLPEKYYWGVIRRYFFLVRLLCKYVLGLDFILKGREHLPKGGCIIAAKHQSAYETLMLPILFDHPVVIIKQELLNIPLWGWYAARAGMIGIDRSKPRDAMPKMAAGVTRAAEQGRTIVIFPQGTRVGIHQTPGDKPYKRGIAELYELTRLPVIPMALNSGLYWPRNAFIKRGGTVTIEFLPALPAGLSRQELMERLQQTLEDHSNRLVQNP